MQRGPYENDRGPIFSKLLQQVRLAGSLLHCIRTKLVYFEFASFREKNALLMTVSVETVSIAKYSLRKNQSERSNLPQDYLTI